MKYRVVPSLWRPVPNQVWRKGDVVPEETLARLGPVSSWRRLGLIEPIGVPHAQQFASWWDGLTKPKLIEAAIERGIDVDPTATKKDILNQIKGGA